MQVATRSIQAMVTVAAVLLAESAVLAQAIVLTNFGAQPVSRDREVGQLARGADLGLDKRRGH